MASLIYPSVMGKRSRHVRSGDVFDLLLNIMLHCLFRHVCKVAKIAANLSICLATCNSLPPIGSFFIKFMLEEGVVLKSVKNVQVWLKLG
jgi:hypothetical protein